MKIQNTRIVKRGESTKSEIVATFDEVVEFVEALKNVNTMWMSSGPPSGLVDLGFCGQTIVDKNGDPWAVENDKIIIRKKHRWKSINPPGRSDSFGDEELPSAGEIFEKK